MAVTILPRPAGFTGWSLLRNLVAVDDTAITNEQTFRSFNQILASALTFQVVNVALYDAIRISVFGVGINADTVTMFLNAWGADGPGCFIYQAVGTMGNSVSQDSADAAPGFHSSADTDAGIRAQMLPGTDYRAVSSFGATIVDVDNAVTELNQTDGVARLELDFSRTQYSWLSATFTGLGAGANQADSAVAIYRPTKFRDRVNGIGIT